LVDVPVAAVDVVLVDVLSRAEGGPSGMHAVARETIATTREIAV
jgi:hypothetical protein